MTVRELAVLALLAAGGAAVGAPPDRVPAGTWGGDHVGLEVAENRSQVEFDCAHGTLEGPLRLDAGGRFDVEGTYVQERGGPEREGEDQGRPARYSGACDGETLTLTLTLADTGQALGPYRLTRGKPPLLNKCL
jgi:hypothetical protein